PERDGQLSWLAPSQQNRGAGGDNPPTTDTPEGPILRSARIGNTETASQSPGGSGGQSLPLWIQAAVRFGYRYLPIAATGPPVASSAFQPRVVSNSPCCCAQCCRVHPPVMDEYYFWLCDSRYFESQIQDADWGATKDDPTSDWQRPDKLPGLLDWPAKRMVRL